MPDKKPVLVRPNSEGVASLLGLVDLSRHYLGRVRADGTITLEPVDITPFVGEQKG